MSLLLPLLGAVGVWLFFSGLPAVRRPSLGERSAPFLRHLTSGTSSMTHRPGDGTLRKLLVPSGFERRSLERRLEAAGAALTPDGFRMKQIAWAVIGASVVTAMSVGAGFSGTAFDARAVPVLAAIIGIVGFLLPDHLLVRSTDLKRRRLRADLPVAIDLLTLSIMAGESVLGACARVAALSGGETRLEFGRVCSDARAGATVTEALEALSQRTDCAPVGRLVDALAVAIERGAPVADVLRSQADDMRADQRRDLMEMAGRREILMLVPVVFLVLPVIVLFVLYPGLVSLDLLVP